MSGCDGKPAPAPSSTPLGLTFPANFVWGASTAAYQIEGAVTEDGRKPSIWDTFSHSPNRIYRNDTGDVADDHYHRWSSDLDLMKSLGLRGYRFSIAWPRVVPDGVGAPNQKGLDFYRRLVDGLHQRGITPMATLFHWDLPQALQDRGGWENRDCAKWFADYAGVVYRALGDAVPAFLTINEPKTIVSLGYTFGKHAPGRSDPEAAQTVLHHLALAHGLAVQALRASGRKCRIGPALSLSPVYPVDGSDAAKQAATAADGQENRIYLDPILRGQYPQDALAGLDGSGAALRRAIRDGDLAVIKSPVDLLGVQYYTPAYVDSAGGYQQLKPTSAANWEQIYPTGLYDLLTRLKRDYGDIPLAITENGAAVEDELKPDGTVDDRPRIDYLRDHLAQAHRAIQSGVKLESYHLWSLMDNFEWAEGYGQRWGIVYVDYKTQKRIPKNSATWYREVIARNGI
ncbi:MAG: beta-glucosidase [Actinobacteria bacterium 13_2_20CM_2_71_6]|nr:MAG: beta-glucosidase [Actinobacteria bacterium 13_2_20CM_2_71_6]